MMLVAKFAGNPFQENTYVLYDDTKECIIIDPGCYTEQEKKQLLDFITQNELKPIRLINTHCHLDHIFGNHLIHQTFGLLPEYHRGEIPVIEAVPQVCQMYGVPNAGPFPHAEKFIEEGDIISFGNTKLSSILTPGHSPASLSFYCEEDKILIAGDVLFYGSIGRSDLPGGNFDTLIKSIKEKLFLLPDDVVVYPGHGPATSIGYERHNNPFVT